MRVFSLSANESFEKERFPDAEDLIFKSIDSHSPDLRVINKKIHDNPELGFEEFQAHDNIVAFLRSHNIPVTPHAYGVETSFCAEYGSGGRVVAFNAEYDALPGIGHACGHNLIATGSIAAFLGVVDAMRIHKIPGRVRLIGTPAEEGAGGKLVLIKAGAYKDVDACLMTHPSGGFKVKPGITGIAYGSSIAVTRFTATFTGRPAHAAASPEQGINALDAVVLAYNGVSMLRQQIKSDERIHGVISEGGTRPNIITAKGSVDYYVRSPTIKGALALQERVFKCFEGAATATGCTLDLHKAGNDYSDLVSNKALCTSYADTMAKLGFPVACDITEDQIQGQYSTDMGNVSHVCPGFHATYNIPSKVGHSNHTLGFAAAAGTDIAHDLTLITAKAMAATAWRFLGDDEMARQVKRDFELDVGFQEGGPACENKGERDCCHH